MMSLLSFSPSLALVAVCRAGACSADSESTPSNAIRNCSSYSDSCYPGGKRIRTCNTCDSGYTRTKSTTTLATCTGDITYYYCKSSGSSGGDIDPIEPKPDLCDGTCDDCVSDGRWKHDFFNSGYESHTVRTCNTFNCVCMERTQYRCAAGYYGSSINGTSGCTRCPSSGGVYGTSVADSNIKITDCYMTGGSDDTGTFTYTSKCYYTE